MATISPSNEEEMQGALAGACAPADVPVKMNLNNAEEPVQHEEDDTGTVTGGGGGGGGVAAEEAPALQVPMVPLVPVVPLLPVEEDVPPAEGEASPETTISVTPVHSSMGCPCCQSSAPSAPFSTPATRKRVHFSHVQVRNYKTTIGDNPCCSYGPPLSLDWEYREDNDGHAAKEGIPIDLWENSRPISSAPHPNPHRSLTQKRKTSQMLMNATQRCARLFQAGYTMEQMKAATEEIKRERFRRGPHSFDVLDPIYVLQEIWIFQLQPLLFKRFMRNQEEALEKQMERELRKMERRVRAEHRSQCSADSLYSKSAFSASIKHLKTDDDAASLSRKSAFKGAAARSGESESPENSDNNSHHRVYIEGMDVLSPTPATDTLHSKSSGRLCSTHDGHDCEDHVGSLNSLERYQDSDESSSLKSYGIQVDRKQHDRATEIILCSLRRPHMRAFHASWFSFFAAFFCWFSITPLLGEIKESLHLTTDEIWLSSFMGTLSTIVMRIIMGPLCDKFGARKCMAFILMSASIPTALTGIIQTSTGLYTLRLFIGLGGSSFVACQYWTSDMFTREVAGTANALAAGWGNLGGGVANLVMGSALFPLLRLIYNTVGYEDYDDQVEAGDWDCPPSSELAWRTIFVIPAVVAFATAVVILRYCDDSPTGSYSDRIKNERMIVTAPMESLCASFQNWNVWILSLQYACCFGVEVTMTNATALYFHEEFGQSTVQAAAISSIFGFMNLFARGMGGFGSDWMQKLSGVRGRLLWQMLVLVLEGLMIIAFAHIESMAGSIVTLVFLSIMVQAAEGSTFGIVPYVDTRFTGSVVGLVGCGGNVGAALFSLFFIGYSYRPAFLLMGVASASSAILSLFMNTKRIARIQDTLNVMVQEREMDEDDAYTPATSGHDAEYDKIEDPDPV